MRRGRAAGPDQVSGSFRRQIVVVTAAVTALGAVLLTLLVQLVLARTAVRNADTVLRDRAEAVISSTAFRHDTPLPMPPVSTRESRSTTERTVWSPVRSPPRWHPSTSL